MSFKLVLFFFRYTLQRLIIFFPLLLLCELIAFSVLCVVVVLFLFLCVACSVLEFTKARVLRVECGLDVTFFVSTTKYYKKKRKHSYKNITPTFYPNDFLLFTVEVRKRNRNKKLNSILTYFNTIRNKNGNDLGYLLLCERCFIDFKDLKKT